MSCVEDCPTCAGAKAAAVAKVAAMTAADFIVEIVLKLHEM